MMIRSGRSQSATVDPHGWISRTADCTSPISPSRLLMLISCSSGGSLGSLTSTMLGFSPFQACFWKNFSPVTAIRAADQRQWPADDVGRGKPPDFGIVVRKPLLGYPRIGPVQPIRVGELHCPPLRFCRLSGSLRCLEHDFACWLVFAQSSEGSVAKNAAGSPGTELDLGHHFGPDIANLSRFLGA